MFGLLAAANLRPFLRWAGSKRRLLPELLQLWRLPYRRYYEPFMGSAAFYFALQPDAAVLSDINVELVTTFQAVRSSPRTVFRELVRLGTGRRTYKRLCKPVDPHESQAKRAARFIFLNRYCFNGLYRTNRAGVFNVPFSPQRSGSLPTEPDLVAVSRLLTGAEIRCADFEEALRDARAGDFAYLDPPYALTERRVFRQYGPLSFRLLDLPRLNRLLVDLDHRGVHFVVSYAYCQEAREAFGRWHTRKVFIQRNVAGFAQHRRRAAELLASNTSL